MPNPTHPTWDVWYNNREEAFSREQRVSLIPVMAKVFNKDQAVIKKSLKDYDCIGCGSEIRAGDLYARTGKSNEGLTLCLNCVTVEDGMFGHKGETVEMMRARLHAAGMAPITYLDQRRTG